MSFYERLLEQLPSMREAREEGREEGELLGMRKVELRTLANRFTNVPAEIKE